MASEQSQGQVAQTNPVGSFFGTITNHIFSTPEERAKLTTMDYVLGALSSAAIGGVIGAKYGYERGRKNRPLSPFASNVGAGDVYA